jgi:diguanylate cyclase (GGDEF)-like protein/PAS domain S-box-containing protein
MARTIIDLDENMVRTALQQTGLERESDLVRYALTALLERKESEDRYRTILEQIQEGYYEVDLTGSCTFFTAPLSGILGYSEAELKGMNYRQYMDKDNAEKVFRTYNEVFRTGISTKHVDWELIKQDGSRIYVETSVTLMRDLSGKPIGFQGIVRDITLRKKMEEEIKRLSITDPLTGLYNRRGFLTLAEQHLKVSERIERGSILLFADLDDLKIINDTWGHRKGDEALVEAAAIFKEVFRESDVIARMGGDEFAILALDTSLVPREAPRILKDRLHRCISLHNARQDRDYTISMSIGIAFHDLNTPCFIDDLMSRADALMYEQKKQKREYQSGHGVDQESLPAREEESL